MLWLERGKGNLGGGGVGKKFWVVGLIICLFMENFG